MSSISPIGSSFATTYYTALTKVKLKGLAVAASVVAIMVVIIAYIIYRGDRGHNNCEQKEADKDIEKYPPTSSPRFTFATLQQMGQEKCSALQLLCLRNARLTDGELQTLAQSGWFMNVKELDLSHNPGITCEGMEHVVTGFQALTALDCSHNHQLKNNLVWIDGLQYGYKRILVKKILFELRWEVTDSTPIIPITSMPTIIITLIQEYSVEWSDSNHLSSFILRSMGLTLEHLNSIITATKCIRTLTTLTRDISNIQRNLSDNLPLLTRTQIDVCDNPAITDIKSMLHHRDLTLYYFLDPPPFHYLTIIYNDSHYSSRDLDIRFK